VWNGSGVSALACTKALLGTSTGDGATPLVPRKLLSRSADALPAIVDHRLDGTEGPVRDQSTAPACTAFATAAAVDHAIARWTGTTVPVSVMQIWSRYHSPFMQTSLASNLGQPIGPEKSWPFAVSEAVGWVPCNEFPKPPKAGCGKPVDDARAQSLVSSAIAEVTSVEYLGASPDTLTLQAKIAAGQDVLIAFELPAAFVPKGRAGARYVPHYTKSAGEDAGHAVLLAGYVRLPHATYFLAHNSWGTSWGDGGYAWMHEATIAAWVRDSVVIAAEPIARDATGRPRRNRGETTCAGDLVQDSIRGTCSAACPDGSPRHDGVCAIAGQCPQSFVNLSGACVLAAPAARGSDPDTGIAWTCGPGGCSYTIPRASDPSCTGATCKASCPAPDFHVARRGSALVCLE
jgi:hypothetical protein